MIAEGLKYLANLGKDALGEKVIDVEGRKYSTGSLVPVLDPMPQVMEVHTLQALVDYVTAGFDAIDEPVVHVEGPTKVVVTMPIDNCWEQRPVYVKAVYFGDSFPWGQAMSQEVFMAFLQARFLETDDRAALLKVMGNVKDENVTTHRDDGVSQSVTAYSGITRVEQMDVPNPAFLCPYRTFPEIAQPVSPFVVRLAKGDGTPVITLLEADGGRWRLESVAGIREWLASRLPERTIILA